MAWEVSLNLEFSVSLELEAERVIPSNPRRYTWLTVCSANLPTPTSSHTEDPQAITRRHPGCTSRLSPHPPQSCQPLAMLRPRVEPSAPWVKGPRNRAEQALEGDLGILGDLHTWNVVGLRLQEDKSPSGHRLWAPWGGESWRNS